MAAAEAAPPRMEGLSDPELKAQAQWTRADLSLARPRRK